MGTQLRRVPRDTPFQGPGARQFPVKAQMFGIQCLQREMDNYRDCNLQWKFTFSSNYSGECDDYLPCSLSWMEGVKLWRRKMLNTTPTSKRSINQSIDELMNQ